MDQSPHSPNFQWMPNPFGLGHRQTLPDSTFLLAHMRLAHET